eukprot:615036-Amphidinium_carterae.1
MLRRAVGRIQGEFTSQRVVSPLSPSVKIDFVIILGFRFWVSDSSGGSRGGISGIVSVTPFGRSSHGMP